MMLYEATGGGYVGFASADMATAAEFARTIDFHLV